jgi:hypothetical protein
VFLTSRRLLDSKASTPRVDSHVALGKGLIDQIIDLALVNFMSEKRGFPKHEYKKMYFPIGRFEP